MGTTNFDAVDAKDGFSEDGVKFNGGASSGTTRGTVLIQPAQANSVAADVATLVADFNALLAKLRAAGVIAP